MEPSNPAAPFSWAESLYKQDWGNRMSRGNERTHGPRGPRYLLLGVLLSERYHCRLPGGCLAFAVAAEYTLNSL